MAEEEFQESEVIFQEDMVNSTIEKEDEDDVVECRLSRNHENPKRRKKKKTTDNSIPVDIPGNRTWGVQCVELDFFNDEGGGGGEGELVPPHVIVGRQRVFAGKMAFSVCSGNGRTLKGRDLSQVRNSILRMTGFLET
ncbi:hypothetical protein Vadar_028924 [Vaccinium darrowii]|uniref:Uncharacterized protein n=1 Tax=Vaccinium darrowii TaxID=229202 RepID=A0ACB7XKN6_9ERIC|nr:hypothetical protein Vadar_028924 [Vaccinium darrowii]